MTQDLGLIITEMTGQRICVSHGSMTPPAEFFAHTIPQSVRLNTCELCSGIASSGAASVHIRPAYQICGAKQQICEGGYGYAMADAYMYKWAWWPHLPSLGHGGVGPQVLHLNTPSLIN